MNKEVRKTIRLTKEEYDFIMNCDELKTHIFSLEKHRATFSHRIRNLIQKYRSKKMSDKLDIGKETK